MNGFFYISLIILILSDFANAGLDAWDYKDKQRYISTKIEAQKFSLTVASLDENNENFQKYSGYVCLRVKSPSYTSPWKKIYFKNQTKKRIDLTINRSIGGKESAAIELKKVENSCLENSRIYESSDKFTIRPLKFVFSAPKNLKSQKRYLFKNAIKAINAKGEISKSYNFDNLTLSYTKRDRNLKPDSSLKGELKSKPITFKEGVSDLEISFSDTANILLKLIDENYCKIDKESPSSIKGEADINFLIDHFNLQFISPPSFKNAHENYTYLSNDLNMSAFIENLSLIIEAAGEANKTLFNYKDPKDRYFANLLDINQTALISPSKDLIAKEANLTLFDQNISFKDGKAKIDLKKILFNYERNESLPKNPFFTNKESNITVTLKDTLTKAKGKIFAHIEKSALFFYAKTQTKDLKTDKNPSKNEILIEIYCKKDCDKYFKNFEEEEINWFINRKDNQTSLFSYDFVPKNSPFLNSDPLNMKIQNIKTENGEIKFNILSKNSKSISAYFHINIPSWLWKSDYYGYSFEQNSSCAQHPCFKYLYIKNSSANPSKNETLLEDTNISVEKRYPKVFR